MDGVSPDIYQRLTNTKQTNPNLKVMVALGGWSFTDPGEFQSVFPTLVSTEANRALFISNLLGFLVSSFLHCASAFPLHLDKRWELHIEPAIPNIVQLIGKYQSHELILIILMTSNSPSMVLMESILTGNIQELMTEEAQPTMESTSLLY